MAGAGLASGERIDARAHVTDIAPTLLALAGAPESLQGAKPMSGRNLLPLLRGETDAIYGPDDAIVIEVSGNTGVIKGDYKLTRNQKPHGDARWRLYDLSKDPGETEDLSAAFPEIYDDLMSEYAAYSARVGVLEVPEGYNSLDEITRHTLERQRKQYGPYLLAAGAGLLALIVLVIALWRRRKRKA